MNSFDELGIDDALVEALAAEGVERPTSFQQAAIPVIRRGNNLLGEAGPGSGSRTAYTVAILDRLDPDGAPLRALVITPTDELAQRAAETAARLAQTPGHSVAALGSPWVLPERATILFGTADDVMDAVRSSRIKLSAVETLVVDGAGALEGLGGMESLEQILEIIPGDAQRVLLALPMTEAVRDLAERHARKAVHVPPRSVGPPAEEGVRRGTLSYVVAAEDRSDALLPVVDAALQDGTRHVLVFFASEDRAADGGDYLALHGYGVGAPGDSTVPVWLGVDELEARRVRAELDDAESISIVSFDVPADADSMDRRHGGGGGTVLVLPREVAHLRDTARRAGYALQPPSPAMPRGAAARLRTLRTRIAEAVASRDLSGELLTLEPLFERHSPAEVAAGLLALLREGGVEGRVGTTPVVKREDETTAPAWTRLFVSVGAKDGLGPGDLVGAISGEAGVSGAQIGKIEIRETFSLVEVDQRIAERVIRSLNGTTLRGRSARVDLDRGPRSGRQTRGGPRPGTGRPPRGPRSRPDRS
jgi:ATP-dependent RNA helicase DeaD